MRLFRCQACGQALHFEDLRCARCGHAIGYLPGPAILSALEPDGRAWRALALAEGRFRYCANADYEVCNWLVPARSHDALCLACRHNRTLPDLSVPENLPPWRRWEEAKRRLIYALRRLGLPHPDRRQDPVHGLAFDILTDPPGGPPVTSGHAEGVITLALSAADDTERERHGLAAAREPAGLTPLRQLRHDSGLFYWEALVRDGGRLDDFRALFGDERQDHAAALAAWRARGAPAQRLPAFVSTLASVHPLEDFAESWAYWLRMLDTLEMAASLGFLAAPEAAPQDQEGMPPRGAAAALDPYAAQEIEPLVEAWQPLAYALNALNRCAGAPDLHGSTLAPTAIEKLGFIHRMVREVAAAGV